MVQGALFTRDFLEEGITRQKAWADLSDAEVAALAARLKAVFDAFPVGRAVSEADTEHDLIFKVLEAAEWSDYATQARASRKGRTDIPDMLLFASVEDKQKANQERNVADRFRHGRVIVENKAWLRPLDRQPKNADDLLDNVPSTQILRYMSIAEVQSERRIQWGILTNGRHWRLYHQGARSRSEEFLEIDLPALLGVEGIPLDLFAPPENERAHWLKVFLLAFRRQSFVPDVTGRTFHQAALSEGRMWEERVRRDLGEVVFQHLFRDLVRGLAESDPARPRTLTRNYLEEVRQAALTLLYRLLFVLYAEDRLLLPVESDKYRGYSLRESVRRPVMEAIDRGQAFSARQDRLFDAFRSLCASIDQGDPSLGLPPYNGGLFDARSTPLLDRAELPDAVFGPLVDRLSRHEREAGRRRWINFRDLQVQHLGSIYERLLEFEVVADPGGGIDVRPNIFARKGSGSYYTPDELVKLIIERTVGPLLDETLAAFRTKVEALRSARGSKADRLEALAAIDPATAMLNLKICDPAMGSGHFLVALVDYLADRILEAVIEAEHAVDWAGDDAPYHSPLVARIAAIREHIERQAEANGWTVAEGQLDDRLVVRRMILKRVIYGVDKNAMAVELAKVALWLHTFTVGAPLSFLDHHLRCGNSLFGEWVRPVMEELSSRFKLTINRHVQSAKRAAEGMRRIENASDADIVEVKNSAQTFATVIDDTRPLDALLDLRQGLRWAGVDDLSRKNLHPAVVALFDGTLGNLLTLATGGGKLADDGGQPDLSAIQRDDVGRLKINHADIVANAARLLGRARDVNAEQSFLHWEVAFPDVWDDWTSARPTGGFDAIIGNPPWDRMKMQEVEWFAARRPEIAHSQRAADRKKLIDQLYKSADPLTRDYEHAQRTAEAAIRVARTQKCYPLLSGGDVNIYSLFVERAFALIRPQGMVGLLVPSGIASDKGASEFFGSVATTGRLAALLDFENRRQGQPDFFPDVDGRFKFCAFVAGGPGRQFAAAKCAFFLHAVDEISGDGRSFDLTAEDFVAVNPNTGTAPVFRTARDATITTGLYRRLPVLVRHGTEGTVSAWNVRYSGMFHMTNASAIFHTADELTAKGCYPVAGNRWKKGERVFVPLYEGKMVQAYDHRAASVVVNPENLHRPAQQEAASLEQHADPSWQPAPQFWVDVAEVRPADVERALPSADPVEMADLWVKAAASPWPVCREYPQGLSWALGFKDVTAPTNMRTMIAAALPFSAFGNKVPLFLPRLPNPLVPERPSSHDLEEWHGAVTKAFDEYVRLAPLWLANLNSVPFDFVARQKVHGQTLNLFIIEQLPVVPNELYNGVIGRRPVADLIKAEALKLTYTAHDMQGFARDMGYDGPPFAWDKEERRHSTARLDALYFMLYGLEEADAAYILETFPIVREQDEAAFGRYRTKELILSYMRALAAGDADARVAV